MLRMIQSTSSARAKSYFSTADYYSEGQELVGQWRGEGAKRLGLSGTIQQIQWDRLCENQDPATGERLTPRSKEERRVGFDLNFHSPKSLSVLYTATQDPRLLAAFQDAVQSTMTAIELEAKGRVRRNGGNEDRVTGNLVYGEYTHLTSRPVGGEPDPHLHSHCYVLNGTFDAVEGKWKALQIGDIKRDAPYFEAVFHSALARNLASLGLHTERTRTGWELKGFSQSTLSKFSRRTAQIEAMAREKGITDPKAKDELGARTREKKAKNLSMPQLRQLWWKRLSPDEQKLVTGLGKQVGRSPIPEDAKAAREAVSRAVAHCFERASVVPERTLLATALKQGVGVGSRQSIESLVSQHQLIRGERKGRRWVTTREVLNEEQRMLAFAREGRGACRPINPKRTTFNRDWLNQQQRDAVTHVLQSRDLVTLIRGAAGTGKTTMMQEAKEGIEAAGMQVHAFAPSAGASRDVLRREGFESADTVARLLADPKLQEQVRGGVIWVDEAGLLGTRTMSKLFECASRLKSRLVLSGDRRQHGSVERGAALRLLEEEAGLRPAELTEIQRQKDEYKAAVRALSEGRSAEGLNRLNKLGWIREVEDESRYTAIAEAYLESVKAGESALVVSPTHAEGHTITLAIREKLRAENLLGKATRQFSELKPANLTVGQQRDATSYQPGDVLVFHQNAKGHTKGDRVVVGNQPLPLDQAERFSVYRSGQLELSPGDRIRITKNGKSREDRSLNNGAIFTVKSFKPNGDVVAAPIDAKNPKDKVVIPADYGHLTYGLVVTSHVSQGKTVDRVFLGQSSRSFGAGSQEQFYVSTSRGRKQALVFTDDKLSLLEAVSKSDERLSGTEFVREQAMQRMARERNAQAAREPALRQHEREREQQRKREVAYER